MGIQRNKMLALRTALQAAVTTISRCVCVSSVTSVMRQSRIRTHSKKGTVGWAHTCKPHTLEAEAGRSPQAPGQPELRGEFQTRWAM